MKKLIIAMALGCLLASPALALDLHAARAQGSLGEQADGYVAVLKPGSDVQALAADVNAKRKQEYARISKSNGQSASVVGTLAAQQIAGTLAAGSKYQSADGSWKTK